MMTTSRKLSLLLAALGFAVAGCRKDPPANPLDLLRAGSQLVEANVAGRDRTWVLGQLAKTIRIDDEVRRTLPASAPSRLRYSVDIPKGAHLSFSYGLSHGFDQPGLEFVVKAGPAGREEIVWTAALDPIKDPVHRHWVAADVDLSKYAGREMSLVFETRSEASDDLRRAFWGTPMLQLSSDTAPLVIVYLVDTLRADHTNPYGYGRNTTPELLAYSKDAVVFEHAIAHASWTKPSTASMLTGLLPGRHRAVQLRDALDPSIVTLPAMLHAKGYATGGAIANWIIYWQGSNLGQGFDWFQGIYGETERGDRPSKDVKAAKVVDTALRWLDTRRGFPTFLYVHTIDPHVPYTPPPPFDQMFEPHPTPEHPAVDPHTDYLEPLDRERMIAQYDGDVAYGDREFGRFIRELKARGLYDRALVVFMADHGEEFLDHGKWMHGRSVFDELVRIPMIVKFPGQQDAGRRIEQQVQVVDVMPTILASQGLPLPGPSYPGRPMQSVIKGGAPDLPAPSEISHRGIVAHGMRTNQDKYVQRFGPEEDELYFDLKHDPLEKQNRITEFPDRVRLLKAGVEATMAANPYRHTIKFVGAGVYDVELRTRGWIESVAAVGLGQGERQAVEGNGRRLVVHTTPRLDAPREVSFSVRPLGAPVWLDGKRDGRALRPAEVVMAQDSVHPDKVPFQFPEVEEPENEESAAERTSKVLSAPKSSQAGLHLWLTLVPGQKLEDLDKDARERLKALGYLGN